MESGIAIVEPAPARTLTEVGEAHGGAFPGFLTLRHALAAVILLHHTRVLLRGAEGAGARHGDIPVVHGLDGYLQAPSEFLRPGLYALVGAFFALSGFLVTGSALRNRAVGPFLTLRALRIVPALTSEILLSALLLGPFLTVLTLGAYFTDPTFLAYFLNVIGFAHYELPGVFLDNPIPRTVNGNLWTLAPEFYCYLLMAGAMASGLLFRRRALLAVACVGFLAAALAVALLPDQVVTRWDGTRFTRWFIVYMFVLGMLFAVFADRIRIHPGLFAASGLAYLGLMLAGGYDLLAGVFLAYCTIYVGTLEFGGIDRYVRSDYSYGIYLYGYPIAQALIAVLLPSGLLGRGPASTALLIVLTFALTLAFAALSWRWIEKPFLGLKRYVGRPRPPA